MLKNEVKLIRVQFGIFWEISDLVQEGGNSQTILKIKKSDFSKNRISRWPEDFCPEALGTLNGIL